MNSISLVVNDHKFEYKDNILTVAHIEDINGEEVFKYRIDNIEKLEFEINFYLTVWVCVDREKITFEHLDFFNKIRGSLKK